MEDEPKITEEIERRKEQVLKKAESQGHLLGEWRWDGHGHWRASCQHKNCLAAAWVNAEEPAVQPYGGSATLPEFSCTILKYPRSSSEQPNNA